MAVFGFLLASFPARNSDIWGHFASGRALLEGQAALSSTWLYDLVVYAIFSAFGGTALALVKSVLCSLVAAIVFVMSARRGSISIPLAVSGLAVLAMGSRLLLQPATVSVLLLIIVLWKLFSDEARSSSSGKRYDWWPGWFLVVLFALWSNLDERVVIGLAVVALISFGQLLDARPLTGNWRAFGPRAGAIAILTVAACASPSGIRILHLPTDLQRALSSLFANGSGSGSAIHSPFTRAYLDDFRESPAALAVFPLMFLGIVSFLLNRKGWRWTWFLPWLALAIASGIQVRLVPFFAVVAGPVTAWNLVSFFANRGGQQSPVWPRVRFALRLLTGIMAIAFLAAAWPGWLQGPPFEPRRWVLETPVATQAGAAFLRRAHENHLWAPESRTLYLTPETESMFAWFCMEDRGVHDQTVVDLLLKPEEVEKARARLRDLHVNRIVLQVADPSDASRAALDRLLADSNEWPVLHLTGGVVVFGWRDPAEGRDATPYKGWEVDFEQRAFRPEPSEVAPPKRTPIERRWWDAFWKPAPPPRPADRDEAIVLLKKSEAMLGSAPFRHLITWEAGQIGGVVSAAGGWNMPAGPVDAAIRVALVSPRVPADANPNTPFTRMAQLTFELEQRFGFELGHAPVGILYDSIRASRRAIAENPGDASAYFVLGQTYAALVRSSSEQFWAMKLPQLMRLRQIQASAALNRAVALNPKLAGAHLELGRLYLTMNCLDLAQAQLRAYRDAPTRWGGPKQGDRRADAILAELKRLTDEVESRTSEYAKDSAMLSVIDRANLATSKGLGGAALDLLLKSDVSAFGVAGMELECDLLLRTGRPADVLEWTTPELRVSLGEFTYAWLRAQAEIALGEYDAADTELESITGKGTQLPPTSEIGTEVAGVVGKALLDGQPGRSYAPQFVMRILSEFDFRTRMTQIKDRLTRAADVMVLRGLVSLEAGAIERARAEFRAALLYSPARWGGGQLEFNGRRVAWDCLSLIDNAAAKVAPAP